MDLSPQDTRWQKYKKVAGGTSYEHVWIEQMAFAIDHGLKVVLNSKVMILNFLWRYPGRSVILFLFMDTYTDLPG